MTIRTFSSREFNQDIGSAKQAALKGPVIITDRGRPSFVMLNIEEYEVITGSQKSITDLLAMSDGDFEFSPEKVEIGIKPMDFS